MSPVGKSDGASSSSTKPNSRSQDERRRKRLRVERDSDSDVQILEDDDDLGLPSGRSSQKFSSVGSKANKNTKEPEASGKRGHSDNSSTSGKTKAEHKGKGKMWFHLLVSLTCILLGATCL